MGQLLGCVEDKTPVEVDEAAEAAYKPPLGPPNASNPQVFMEVRLQRSVNHHHPRNFYRTPAEIQRRILFMLVC